jgi:hypothetical protein
MDILPVNRVLVLVPLHYTVSVHLAVVEVRTVWLRFRVDSPNPVLGCELPPFLNFLFVIVRDLKGHP